jgi:peptide-methionine (S)-S-oxide reductase
MFTFRKKPQMPSPEQALPGRSTSMPVPERHFVNGHPLKPPFPEGMEVAMLGLGCFWGAERTFWELKGVYTTAVGYAGGFTPNPIYEEICSGLTGHAEVVLVGFDPKRVSYEELLKVFWGSHDPTQGMRQGNDSGTQYPFGDLYLQRCSESACLSLARRLSEVLGRGRLWTDHDRDPRGPNVLLCRRVSSAVSG